MTIQIAGLDLIAPRSELSMIDEQSPIVNISIESRTSSTSRPHMTRPLTLILALLLSSSALAAGSQKMQHPQGTRMGFPFHWPHGITGAEVASQMDSHFAKRHSVNINSIYRRVTLEDPRDSLYFEGLGPVMRLEYRLFRDTLLETRLDFLPGIMIDTTRFVRLYSHTGSYRGGYHLILQDSSFAIDIDPRWYRPSITFLDMQVQQRGRQYEQAMAKQLAEDSVVFVVTADSGTSTLPEKVVSGDEKYSPLTLSLGETLKVEDLMVTIRFIGIGTRKSQVGKDLTPQNATLFFAIDHNGLKKQVAISAASDEQCVGLADDLPYWLVCASGFKRLMGTYQVLVNISQYARL